MTRIVIIATPADDGRVDVRYTASLIETVKLAAAQNIVICPVFIPYDALVQRARNEFVQIAMENEAHDLVFIDADQAWNPSDFLRLLRHPVDVVGAAVRKKQEHEEYNVLARETVIDEATGLMKVDGVGTGFLRLSRKAFSALWDISVPYTNGHGGRPCRQVFDVEVMQGVLVGEDIVACFKLRASGFDIHLDPTVHVDHVGAKVWRGDFADFLKRLQARSA